MLVNSSWFVCEYIRRCLCVSQFITSIPLGVCALCDCQFVVDVAAAVLSLLSLSSTPLLFRCRCCCRQHYCCCCFVLVATTTAAVSLLSPLLLLLLFCWCFPCNTTINLEGEEILWGDCYTTQRELFYAKCHSF